MQSNDIRSKSDFLAWRAQWRAGYRKLSGEIRELKVARKAAQRDGYGSYEQSKLAEMRKRAAQMMIERTEVDQAGRERRAAEIAARTEGELSAA